MMVSKGNLFLAWSNALRTLGVRDIDGGFFDDVGRDRIYILPGQEDLELRAVRNMTAELESLR